MALYEMIWKELPWWGRALLCGFSFVVAGYCASPLSIYLRTAFTVDQRQGCVGQYLEQLERRDARVDRSDRLAKAYFGCLNQVDPSFGGEIRAAGEGRSAAFSPRP